VFSLAVSLREDRGEYIKLVNAKLKTANAVTNIEYFFKKLMLNHLS
jgi:hypothetical protein